MAGIDYDAMSDNALRAFITAHRDRYGCDPTWDDVACPTQGTCPAADAEQVLNRREYIAKSRLPGENPCIYIPGVQTATYRNIAAREIAAGYVAAHRANPGQDGITYYVEAYWVQHNEDDTYTVAWRKTNSPEGEPTFQVTYEADDYLDVSHSNPITTTTASEGARS